MKRLLSLVAVAGLLAVAPHARAEFPDHPIRLIVPFAPGGSTDVVARRFAPALSQLLGQQVVVENRGGAGATIATDMVAKAPPDGYTLLMATNSHTVNPFMYDKLPYDTVKDFVSVAMVGESSGLIVVNPTVKQNTLPEFIEYARTANPPLTYGTAGAGTFPHLTTLLLLDRANFRMTHIPYGGAGPAMNDLLGGVYQFKVDAYATAAPQIKAGKLKAYAVTSLERIPQAPDLPTVAELGYPGFDSTFWMAIIAPAKTPKAIVDKLSRAVIASLQDKDVAAKLTSEGVRIIAKPGSAVDERVERELKMWPTVLKKDSGG